MIEVIIVSQTGEGYEIELVGDVVNMIELPGIGVLYMYRHSAKVIEGAGFAFFELFCSYQIPLIDTR